MEWNGSAAEAVRLIQLEQHNRKWNEACTQLTINRRSAWILHIHPADVYCKVHLRAMAVWYSYMCLILRPGEIMITRERCTTSLTLNRREGKTFTDRRISKRKWRNTNAQQVSEWAKENKNNKKKKRQFPSHPFLPPFAHLLTTFRLVVIFHARKKPPWRGMTHFDYLHVISLFRFFFLPSFTSYILRFFYTRGWCVCSGTARTQHRRCIP